MQQARKSETAQSGGSGRNWAPERALQASVNWAVLGLVIEKPSYGYEIGRRFIARFGGFIPASLSNIYTTLDRLVRMGLVEPTHVQASTASGRQHKLYYRATSEGARAYRAWLARRLRELDQRSELLLRLLSVCLRGAPALDEVLDRYEVECVQERRALQEQPPRRPPADPELMPELLARMIDDERRSMLAAQLDWVQRTRAELGDHLERQRHRAASAMQSDRADSD
jgi:DNA-binding PadR family transcriptional regulator